MYVDPKRIKFESTNDLVDYASKGFIPKKEYWHKFIEKVRTPDIPLSIQQKAGKEVIVSENLFNEEKNGKQVLEETLDRVYQNRVENRNKLLKMIGVIFVLFLMIIFVKGKKSD
jgi:hypothetical protein